MIPRVALAVALCGLIAVVAAAQSQSLPNGLLNVTTNGSSGNPWNNTSGQRLQYVYDAANFLFQGPQLITQIYVRAFNNSSAPGGIFSTFNVTLASATVDYNALTLTNSYAANLGTDATLVRGGPWSTGPVTPSGGPVGNWIPIGVVTPFLFNPALGADLVVDITKCGAANMGIALDHSFSGVGCKAVRNTSLCNTALPTSLTNFCAVLKIDFVPQLAAYYQVNQPGSAFDLDGVSGSALTLAADDVHYYACRDATTVAHLASTNVGFPWDLGVTLGGVALPGLGGFQFPDGQISNMNLSDPTLAWFNGLTFTSPFPGNFNVAFNVNFPASVAMQMANYDPTMALSFALSQPVSYHASFGGVAGAPGPTGDDVTQTYTLANLPCAPPTIPFFGSDFAQISVSTNGRVFLGTTAITSPTPAPATALTGPPFAGFHADLNPNIAGNIFVNSATQGVFRIEYNNVAFFAEPTTTASFAVVFDTTTGLTAITGLDGINFPSVPVSAFLGVSPGNLGATDPGSQNFGASTGPISVPGFKPMIYRFGALGPGLVPAGLTSLVFDTNGFPVTWTGQ